MRKRAGGADRAGGDGGSIGQVPRRPHDDSDGSCATGLSNLLSKDNMATLKLWYASLNRDITFEAFMEKYKDVNSLDKIVKTMMELPGKPSTGESLNSQVKEANA
jgi:hypothetical protein